MNKIDRALSLALGLPPTGMTDEQYGSEEGVEHLSDISPFTGKKHTAEWKEEASRRKAGPRHHMFGKKHTAQARSKISKKLGGRILSEKHKIALRKPNQNTQNKRGPKTEAHRLAMRGPKKVSTYQCPKCLKTGRGPVMKRHHFDHCRWGS